jgi:hypothetical protein
MTEQKQEHYRIYGMGPMSHKPEFLAEVSSVGLAQLVRGFLAQYYTDIECVYIGKRAVTYTQPSMLADSEGSPLFSMGA